MNIHVKISTDKNAEFSEEFISAACEAAKITPHLCTSAQAMILLEEDRERRKGSPALQIIRGIKAARAKYGASHD